MFGIATDALAGTGRPFHDRINRFEMTWVGGKPNFDFARSKFAHGAIAQVIFHIAVSGNESGNVILGKLGEDDVQRFSEEICQHIETATMGHAHADFLNPIANTLVQKGVENRHQTFRALQRKSFLPDIALVQKNFEGLRFE